MRLPDVWLIALGLALGLPAEPAASQCLGPNCPQPWGRLAAAQTPAASSAQPVQTIGGCCRIRNAISGALGTVNDLGSGALVASDQQRALVLSCAHLFRDGVGQITCKFPDGGQYGARIIALDDDHDLSALMIARPPADPLPLGAHDPAPGDLVSAYGYGGDGVFARVRGPVRGYQAFAGQPSAEVLEFAGVTRMGDSGGPVCDASGALVGVAWGTDGRYVEATCLPRLRAFVERARRAARIEERNQARPGLGNQSIQPGPVDDASSAGAASESPPLTPLGELARDAERPSRRARVKLEAELERVQTELAQAGEERTALAERLERARQRAADIQAKLDAALAEAPRWRDEADSARGAAEREKGDLRAEIDRLKEQLLAKAKAAAAGVIRDSGGAAPGGAAPGVRRSLELALDAKLIALLAGVGVPGWAAAIGLWIARRRIQGRLAKIEQARRSKMSPAGDREADDGSDAGAAGDAVAAGDPADSDGPRVLRTPPARGKPQLVVLRDDAPPREAEVIRSREFVEVAVPQAELKALQMAMDEIVRRNPGARSFVETVEAYAAQYASGLRETAKRK